MPRILWTREEHLLAFNLYCRIPFGSIDEHNPQVVSFAKMIGRTSAAVSLKLANFARLDPSITGSGRKGMSHGAKGEEGIWREFSENPEELAYESMRILAERRGRTMESLAEIDERELPAVGKERERVVRVRVNQYFFRASILSAYGNRCCVTGLGVSRLLVASHIVPWATSPLHRMNPRNGLCLNALHDRAFDRGLMTVTQDRCVKLRRDLRKTSSEDESIIEWFWQFDGKPLRMPKKFLPDETLLAEHRERWSR